MMSLALESWLPFSSKWDDIISPKQATNNNHEHTQSRTTEPNNRFICASAIVQVASVYSLILSTSTSNVVEREASHGSTLGARPDLINQHHPRRERSTHVIQSGPCDLPLDKGDLDARPPGCIAPVSQPAGVPFAVDLHSRPDIVFGSGGVDEGVDD